MVFNELTVIEEIKKRLIAPNWIHEAREDRKVLDALITGNGFHDVLINKIEKIESKDIAIARKKYSKDIRDLFERVLQPRNNVFKASGGSIINNYKGTKREKLDVILNNFKGQKSITKYFADNFFKLVDVDPCGLLFLEYIADSDIYPTYKSINDIRFYKSNGQLVDYVIFEPKVIKRGKTVVNEWRIVDRENDWRIIQIGQTFEIDIEKTFKHPFTGVPAVILSSIEKVGSERKLSPIEKVVKLAEDFARDKSVSTIYKFQHGFPRHWRYERFCRKCQGAGKTNDNKICSDCKGTGYKRKNDVTDISILDLPREGQPIVTPNIEGFVSPDLETWKQYNSDLKEMADLIDSTIWGTKRQTKGGNETATGRFIDIQPVENKISRFADDFEFSINTIISFVEDWLNGSPISKRKYTYITGRRFIIETSDVLLDKYSKAVADEINSTILDKMLEEIIYSKYQNNQKLLTEMLKKMSVEPYVHLQIKEVSNIFGVDEAYKKAIFTDFWEEVDKTKEVKELKKEFNKYILTNKLKKDVKQK